jgi:uncharacterized protein YkwD
MLESAFMKLAAVVVLSCFAWLGCRAAQNERPSPEPAAEADKSPSIDRKTDSRRSDDGGGAPTSDTRSNRPPGGGATSTVAPKDEPVRDAPPPGPTTGTSTAAETDVDEVVGDGGCYKAGDPICGIEREIFRRVNELRAKEGKPLFKYSSKLGFVSRDWSSDQARRGAIGHDGFPGNRNAKYTSEFPGSRSRIRAENVAMAGGGPAAAAASTLFQMWADSPGHRRNMLGNFGALGIGIAQGERGWYGTQLFGETDE